MIDGFYICPVCGKHFACYLPSQWAYWVWNRPINPNKKTLCCSWSCMRKARTEREKIIEEQKERELSL